MTVKVRLLLVIGLVCVLVMIINMVRKRQLELKYVLGWLGCDFVLLLFAIFPGLMVGLSNFLGIYAPVNMIFFLGFLFSLILVFTLTVALSRVTARVRRLAQIEALNAYEWEMQKDVDESGKK